MELNFQELRLQKGMTQKEVVKLSRLTEQTIIRLEQGKGNPTLKTIIKLLDVYGYELRIMKKVWKHLFFYPNFSD